MARNSIVHIRSERSRVQPFIDKAIVDEKLRNVTGVIIFTGLAVFLGYLMSHALVLGLTFTGLLVGLFVSVACISSAELGLYINMVYAFFGFHISRWFFHDELPVGVLSDILVVSMSLNFLIRRKRTKTHTQQFSKSPVAIVFFLIVGYTAIQLCNPEVRSIAGWWMALRKVTSVLCIIYASFIIFENETKIIRFLKVLFVLATITAIYGCIQEWHGFFPFEMEWITSDEHRFGLMFINGGLRKMGTMSDPAEYAIVMASCAALFLVLGIFTKNIQKKIIIFSGCIFMLLAMGYSGTRTANAMIVAGLLVYVLLTIDKPATQRFAIVAGFIFTVLMVAPINNPTVDRFRTTFTASQDASYLVREKNRHNIQPYIYTHPIGGGIGTTGANGIINNAGHALAGFQTDSGYLKKALELGWIGLTLYCVLYFLVLKEGTHAYFGVESRKLKSIYAACVASLFSYYVAEFSQSAIGQITDMFVYYPMVALVAKGRSFLPISTPNT
ncbi:O-antigen ligase family protein [Deminuibacter soli]|uniref:O-antigen ligase-related domain-containing protein n=1 Tax=Deminuibacter soli TaxID=2291815 RepID=A0A3E1NQX9_9BACT|nr:O-antigen ligase family protein [Deminuibacter soli]RFM30188.1 hypothetical protein DXN05_04240 [Deminuibacter soli]